MLWQQAVQEQARPSSPDIIFTAARFKDIHEDRRQNPDSVKKASPVYLG